MDVFLLAELYYAIQNLWGLFYLMYVDINSKSLYTDCLHNLGMEYVCVTCPGIQILDIVNSSSAQTKTYTLFVFITTWLCGY